MVKNPPANAGDMVPWYSKILWRRKWQPTSVFLPGKSHGERSHGVTKSRTQLSTAQHRRLPRGRPYMVSCKPTSTEKGKNGDRTEYMKVQFSCSVVFDSLGPHELQHARPHVWVGDAIQPSHPLSSPSPPAPNLAQHQDLFQWINSLHEVAKVLEFQPQHQSFQWTPRTDLL